MSKTINLKKAKVQKRPKKEKVQVYVPKPSEDKFFKT